MSLSLQFWVRIGIPVLIFHKGESPPLSNHQPQQVITGILINTVRLCLIPVSRGMTRMTTPLPMRISVANLIDQEGCFVTLKAESRDLQLWRLSKRWCVYAQPRLVRTQNPVNQFVQTNPLAPSLLNSQVMRGNPIIIAWLLLDWEGSGKKQLCQLS